MDDIEVTPALYKMYGKHGQLTLSSGFLQTFHENNCSMTQQYAIFQLTNFRMEAKENNTNGCARLRISDGCFMSTTAFVSESLRHQVEEDNLTGGGEIIAIHRMKQLGNNAQGSSLLVIEEYKLLARNNPSLGAPQKHVGSSDVEQFRNFKSTADYSINWGDISWDAPNTTPKKTAGVAMQTSYVTGGGRGAVAPTRQTSYTNVTPISMLTPYVNKWRICGLCTSKEEMRDIRSRNGESMKVFNFDLTDKDGSTIRIAGFGEAAQRAYSIIQTDCTYFVSGGQVKQANKRFNNTGHDYELTLRTDTEITPCHETINRPQFSLKICPLDRISSHSGETVDVLAVVEKMDPLNEFTSKAGNALVKREFQLIDSTGTIVQFVIWNEQARKFEDQADRQVIGIKGALVKEYNGGYSIGTTSGTKWELNPNLTEVPALYEWYERDRPNIETKALAQSFGGGEAFNRDLRLLGTALALNLGNEEEQPNGRYFSARAMVSGTKPDNSLYQACPSENCMKKVVQLDSQYRCEKCNITSDTFKWNYMVPVELSDLSGSTWVTLFNKSAEKLFGKTAQELGELRESDAEAYNRVFDSVRFNYFMWRIRARPETYNEETRIKYQVHDLNEVPYDKYVAEMEKALAELANL